ncbi:serine/threonine-protein kinase [Nocardioides montaniterrae]
MTACTQPGCTGQIVDGYCDVCGSPGSGGATTAVPTAEAVTACAQPGCTGQIVDGYCNVCGAPSAGGEVGQATVRADRSARSAAVPPPPPPLGSSGLSAPLTAGSSSSRVASAAIGSRRVGASGSTSTRRTRTGSTRLRAARIGAGLTSVPVAPQTNPAEAIMANPQVPEEKRTCPKCGAAVGRGRDGQPGRTEGFCPQCGTAFSFTPKLQQGDLVAGQYEIAGALAHGGMGWIYLARDRNVSNRWVVLKGLLNSGDPDALAAAIAEQQFLAQVEHPSIVEIYNFVSHEGAGYIVMEYVGGKSVKELLKARMAANNGVYDPLPVDQALAYILDLLPAFQYLHDLGLVYCDFKPDNMIQVGDAMKLIDLGGVRRVDDQESAIYGTVGYQAPEVAEVGPSVASDIYTIGRTIMVLCTEFRGYQGTYLYSLPPVASTPLFQNNDSLYWLIAKACATDPADRFASVDEMRTQTLGVLRETVARTHAGTALTSAASVLFETPATAGPIETWDQLPALREDTTDPQYSWLATVSADDPRERLAALQQAPEDTAEVWLARARAALEAGDSVLAQRYAGSLLADDAWEWRALWVEGLAAVANKDWEGAKASFNAVYQQVPGELAPKLALAYACEQGGLPEVAEGLYGVCLATDAAYVPSSAFGVARVRAARGDTDGACAALDNVPTTSRGFTQSRRLRAEVLLADKRQDLGLLDQAMRTIEAAQIDPAQRHDYSVRILSQALPMVSANTMNPGAKIGSIDASETAVRDALERSLRGLARSSSDRAQRIDYINRANGVRNWSLL